MAKMPALLAVALCRCPKCRKGHLFCNRSVFPLKGLLKMHDKCSVCEANFQGEANNGPGINFVLTTLLLFLNVLWYYPIFGLSYFDNSIYWFLGSSVLVVALAQPWLMRLSRSIYLHILFAAR